MRDLARRIGNAALAPAAVVIAIETGGALDPLQGQAEFEARSHEALQDLTTTDRPAPFMVTIGHEPPPESDE